MRSLRKPILLLLAIALISSVAVYATVAYFADVETVDNTFSVGKVDITLDETKLDPNGNPEKNPVTENYIKTEEGNNYHLLPGKSYLKDPQVSVAQGSESCYVRMMVSINKHKCDVNSISIFESLFGSFGEFFSGWDPSIWKLTSQSISPTNPDEMIYEFRYWNVVHNGGIRLEPLFTGFTIPGEITGEQLAQLSDMNIVVQAHAIQLEGFGLDENGAWEAFDKQAGGNNLILPPVPVRS